jgi:hypothetical protein
LQLPALDITFMALWGSLWTEIKLSYEKQDCNTEIDESPEAFGV